MWERRASPDSGAKEVASICAFYILVRLQNRFDSSVSALTDFLFKRINSLSMACWRHQRTATDSERPRGLFVVNVDMDPPRVCTRSLGASQNSKGVADSVKFLAERARREREMRVVHGFFAAKVLIASRSSEKAATLRQRVRAENGKALADQRHYANSESELVYPRSECAFLWTVRLS